MRARITVLIGLAVAVLGAVQYASSREPIRLATIAIGVFIVVFGGQIGWTRYPHVATTLGHLAIAAGCLVTAYAVYQIPFMDSRPSLTAVLDLPLFWSLFTIFGGYCMITHGCCSCCLGGGQRRAT